MKHNILTAGALATLLAATIGCASNTKDSATDNETPLKSVFADKFMIGTAINEWQVSGEDSIGAALAKKHFNTIVAENVMKSEVIAPQKGVYDFDKADEFVKFGEDNDMFIVGHCLVWHCQLAPWFPYDDNGQYVSADTLRQRMHDYITTVVSRYKGRVQAWDVVNEAIEDDGSYTHTPFYDILGEEFIPLAFKYAHEADPDAELYINDYSMVKPGKRDAYVRIVNDLKNQGMRIDGIGIQAHWGMDYPDFAELEKTIDAFAGTGCKVMLTEFDMSALPTITNSAEVGIKNEYMAELDPYRDGLPEDVAAVWNLRMDSVMDICERHADQISRVNFWGIADGDSWRNDWPIPGRIEYPLVFDRQYNMKPFMAKRAAI